MCFETAGIRWGTYGWDGDGREPPLPSMAMGRENARRNPEEDLDLGAAGGGKQGGSLATGGLRATWVAERWSWGLRVSR